MDVDSVLGLKRNGSCFEILDDQGATREVLLLRRKSSRVA